MDGLAGWLRVALAAGCCSLEQSERRSENRRRRLRGGECSGTQETGGQITDRLAQTLAARLDEAQKCTSFRLLSRRTGGIFRQRRPATTAAAAAHVRSFEQQHALETGAHGWGE